MALVNVKFEIGKQYIIAGIDIFHARYIHISSALISEFLTYYTFNTDKELEHR